MKTEKTKKKLTLIVGIICSVLTVIFLTFTVGVYFTFKVMTKVVVKGTSMNPTLENLDVGMMNKVKDGYEFKRWEIVAVEADRLKQDITDTKFIKRIVGLPGDEIVFKKENGNFQLYIDNQIADEKFGKTDFSEVTPYACQEPIKLKQGEYFVCGDNRKDSLDSRYFGCVYDYEIVLHDFWKVGKLDGENVNYSFPKKIS